MTTLTVREVKENERKIWDDFVDNSFSGDILSMWSWGETKKVQGWDPLRIGVFDGDELILAAAGLIKKASFIGNYLYIAHGPVFQSCDNLQRALPDLVSYFKTLNKTHNIFVVEIEPRFGVLDSSEIDESRITENIKRLISPELPKIIQQNGFVKTGRNTQPIYKLYYDLDLSEEQLLALMKKNTRYNIGLAKRKGVEVNYYPANHPEIQNKIDKLYELMLEMQKRAKGYPIRPKSTFERLFKEFKESDNLSLFEVRVGEDVIAINVSQVTKYWSSSFYAGSNRLHSEKKATYLLRWESILKAKSFGSKIYDFWGYIPNSEQHKGYSENKLSFGGVAVNNYGIWALKLNKQKYWLWNVLLKMRSILTRKH